MGELPVEVLRFATEIADDLLKLGGRSLVAVYVHGSAALGDFSPLASDVDMLVVLDDDVPALVVSRFADVLGADRPCPGAGLEASAVRVTDVRRPKHPWPYLVHVCTIPAHRKTVFGHERDGDEDLILHYLVARAEGVAVFGPAPAGTIGEVPSAVVVQQLATELRWAVRHASGPYAVLNACRALRYRTDNTVCSKVAGAEWALAQGIKPNLVQPAIDARRASSTYDITSEIEDWVTGIADALVR